MGLDGVEGVQGEVSVEEVHVGPAPHRGEPVRDPGVYDDPHGPPVHALLGGPGQRARYDRVAFAPGSAELIRESGKKRLAWTTSLSAARSSP